MNKLEQVSILGHQMSLAGGPKLNEFEHVEGWGLGQGVWFLYSDVPGSLGEVQCLGV